MNITVTQRAQEEINKLVQDQEGLLKIYYDDEDCGCAGGVPTLQFVERNNHDNETIVFQSNEGPVLMEKAHQLYFDEDLKIDYSEKMNLFQLKSPSGILNPVMKLVINK